MLGTIWQRSLKRWKVQHATQFVCGESTVHWGPEKWRAFSKVTKQTRKLAHTQPSIPSKTNALFYYTVLCFQKLNSLYWRDIWVHMTKRLFMGLCGSGKLMKPNFREPQGSTPENTALQCPCEVRGGVALVQVTFYRHSWTWAHACLCHPLVVWTWAKHSTSFASGFFTSDGDPGTCPAELLPGWEETTQNLRG